MKKILQISSLLCLFFVCSAGYTYAQETQAVNSSATIKGTISLTKNADLSFGNLTSPTGATTVTVDPNSTNTNTEGSGATTGEIEISAEENTQLDISWDKTTTTLSDGASGTANTMDLTFDVDGNSANASGTATDLTTNTGEQVSTSATGKYYIYLGGALEVGASQASGYYTSDSSTASAGGDVTFTVDYY